MSENARIERIERAVERLEALVCDWIAVTERRAAGEDPRRGRHEEWLRMMKYVDVTTTQNDTDNYWSI